jgi:hypothetical protein
MPLLTLDWRFPVIGAVVLLALYLAYALIRLERIRRAAPLFSPTMPEPPVVAVSEPPPAELPFTPDITPLPVAPDAVGFATRQFMRGVEAELEQVRAELAELREEVAHLKAARQTSPHYAEAMSLAGDGADVQTVADRCGISVAEAELVRALARREEHLSQKDFP